MNVQLPEDLGSIQKVGVVDDPGARLARIHDKKGTSLTSWRSKRGEGG